MKIRTNSVARQLRKNVKRNGAKRGCTGTLHIRVYDGKLKSSFLTFIWYKKAFMDITSINICETQKCLQIDITVKKILK